MTDPIHEPSATLTPVHPTSEALTFAPHQRRRGWPLLAWVVILGLVGLILWRNGQRATTTAAEWLVPMQLQSRYIVGAANSGIPGLTSTQLFEQAKTTLDEGTFSQRMRFAVVAGELSGPREALHVLHDIQQDETLSPSAASAEAARLLAQLYEDRLPAKQPQAGLSDADQQTLRRGLGWFGDLALAPAGGDAQARARAIMPARRTFFGAIAVLFTGVLGLLFGCFLLLMLLANFFVGNVHSRVTTGNGNGGIYAETFAVYMAVFLGLSYASRLLPESFSGLWFSGVVMLLSLAAGLLWPRLRGVPWGVVRQDLGLRCERPLREIVVGVGTYLSALPLLGVGLLVMFALMLAQRHLGLGDSSKPGAGPTHPIINVALTGGWWVWVQMFVVAAILAPLVEETMFRGALYRHLRELGIGWATWASVAFSTLVSGLVFAMIHPQGWLGVPVLFALASAFALSREWRGSLVPAMVAHGINNGISTLLLLLLAS